MSEEKTTGDSRSTLATANVPSTRTASSQTELSCAGCHIPAGTFNDQLRHDVGSGGLVKTPTLLNANFNAPYFHDGRYDTYEEVVGHFDRMFDLELSTQDTQDLVAYLNAVGDGERAFDKDGVVLRMKEVLELSSALEVAIPAADTAVCRWP